VRTLADATARLYAAAPEEFIPTRTLLVAEAKAAGDTGLAREIARLRKPTVAAWAVNLAVREHPAERRRLVEVGGELRGAQARLDAAALRDLRPQREDLLARFVAAAATTAARAGRPLAPAVLEEVRGTFVAALASEEATAAVLSGTLARALAYSGLGEVDLTEAVARTTSGAVLTVVPGGAGGTDAPAAGGGQQSERAPDGVDEEDEALAVRARADRLREAESALAAADAGLAEAITRADDARQGALEARRRVHEVEAALAEARAEQRAAEEAVTEAVRARAAAQARRHTADQALTEARRGN
jgi:hypothetical protein